MSTIEEIKDRLDIETIVSETVTLKRSGKHYTGFCPFHPNSRTPAFVVWPETGTWRCFGECGEGGDIFKFVMKREGWDFPEALRVLAERAGVQLEAPSPQAEARKEEHSRLREALEEAVSYFQDNLRNNPTGKPALDYLHKRDLNDETIQTFELGYAPDGWESGIPHFIEKGFSKDELIGAGLASQREDGSLFNRFRNRVMFPIRDGRGRMTGFGARALSADEQAKYLNSPQTELFDKSNLLYGLDKARKSIRSQDQVVIVEGYFDVIAPYQAGFKNLVSPMGTALTEQHFRQLKRFSRRMIMALDADAAGEKATLRGLDVARKTMDRETEMIYNPRGWIAQEGRLKADIRVTTLPEGLDPDEVVNNNPEDWQKLIDTAKPVVMHVMETLASEQDLNDSKVKSQIASQVLPLIMDIGNPIERDTYTQQLARMLKIDERTLLAKAPSRPTRRSRPQRRIGQQESKPPEHSKKGPSSNITQNLEAHSLSILIRHPELLYRVDRKLQEVGLTPIAEEDFQYTNNQELFRVSQQALEQDFQEPLTHALDNLPMPLVEHADSLLEKSKDINPEEERVLLDLLRTILRLRENTLKEAINQLHFLMQEAQEQGTLITEEYQQAIINNSKTLLTIHTALTHQTL